MFVTGWDAETYASKLAANEVLMGYSNHEGSFYPRAVINKCIATLEQYDLKYDLAAQNKLSTPCEEYRLQTCVYMQSHATWARHFSSGCTPPPTKVRRYPQNCSNGVFSFWQRRATQCVRVCVAAGGASSRRTMHQYQHHTDVPHGMVRGQHRCAAVARILCDGLFDDLFDARALSGQRYVDTTLTKADVDRITSGTGSSHAFFNKYIAAHQADEKCNHKGQWCVGTLHRGYCSTLFCSTARMRIGWAGGVSERKHGRCNAGSRTTGRPTWS